MNKKFIPYIWMVVGVVLVLFGGNLLYLREKAARQKANVVVQPQQQQTVVPSVVPTEQVPTEQALCSAVKTESTESNTAKSQKPQKRQVAFTYRNSKPKSVLLVGDFNKWSRKANPMKLGNNHTWQATLSLLPGEYRYAFIVDGKRINDPNNKKTVHLKRGKASVLVVNDR